MGTGSGGGEPIGSLVATLFVATCVGFTGATCGFEEGAGVAAALDGVAVAGADTTCAGGGTAIIGTGAAVIATGLAIAGALGGLRICTTATPNAAVVTPSAPTVAQSHRLAELVGWPDE